MSEIKTVVNDASVVDFLNSVPDESKRKESFRLLEMFSTVTREKPKMWGSSIVGFGSHKYTYANGKEGDWMIVGFSPRKQALTLYGLVYYDQGREMIYKLGKVKTGKGCLYINKLADIDEKVLQKMIKNAYESKHKL